MNITVFTSNQRRHLFLIKELASICETLYAVIEVKTFVMDRKKSFQNQSEWLQDYFKRLIEAEKYVFNTSLLLPKNVRPIILQSGDLNHLPLSYLETVLNSQYFVVFGSSYIKGELCEILVRNRALNIHMGISPYYRGAACNFWALYDRNIQHVGGTVHLLSKGLDSGDILFHALPETQKEDPFILGMKAVKVTQLKLKEALKKGTIDSMPSFPCDKSKEIRYCRCKDFNDEAARKYLANYPDKEEVYKALRQRSFKEFVLA